MAGIPLWLRLVWVILLHGILPFTTGFQTSADVGAVIRDAKLFNQ